MSFVIFFVGMVYLLVTPDVDSFAELTKLDIFVIVMIFVSGFFFFFGKKGL
jgi:hypothetical protein